MKVEFREIVEKAFADEFAALEDLKARGDLTEMGEHGLNSLRLLKRTIDYRSTNAEAPQPYL